MIIKNSSKDHLLVAKGKYVFFRFIQNRALLTAVIIFFLVSYTGIIFFYAVKADRSGFIRETLSPAIHENYRVPLNYVQGLLTNPERITIDIKFKEYQKLEFQRSQAFKRGLLLLDENDYVKARLRHNGKSYKIRLRLKGDTLNHLQGDKWSFRVKLKGDNTLWGMKQFSLHDPRHRNFLYEWVYHQTLKKVGVIALRYKFVVVTLNGKELGVYAVEEHFEKRLIENNELREGPIVRFTEDLYWDTYHWLDFRQRFDTEAYLSCDIDAFQTSRLQQNSVRYSQFLKAQSLLESFRSGTLHTSDVFDVDKLALFIAVSDLMGGRHCNRWHNKKFYYNPVTSKLEPIGFDSMPGARIESLTCEYNDWFEGFLLNKLHQETIFKDNLFFEKYVQALEKISQPAFLDALFSDISNELDNNLKILYRDFPHYNTLFSKDVLYQNQAFIRHVLHPSKIMNAYIRKAADDRIVLELGNIQPFPLRVTDVRCKGVILSPEHPVILPAKKPSVPVVYQNVVFSIPDNQSLPQDFVKSLKVSCGILGSSREYHDTVFPWPHLEAGFLSTDFIRQKPNVHQIPWLSIDEAQKRIVIKQGEWDVTRSIIIPGGYQVVGEGKIRLNLLNKAVLLSYSPIKLAGSAENPIVINADGGGQGVVIMGAGAPSLLYHVSFQGLTAPSQNGWILTGSVTFYESPVELSHVRFSACRAEDSLNFVRSKFSLDNCLFEQSASDALDADYCKGSIINSSFVACGNDCIDVSGSEIEVKDLFINGAGDKGLSAGENSHMRVKKIDIQQAEIAVASKDLSGLTGSDLEIRDSKIALTVYQKKPEFGPARMSLDGVSLKRISIPYLVEKGSTIIVNGQAVVPSRTKVKEILYGAEYGKSSK